MACIPYYVFYSSNNDALSTSVPWLLVMDSSCLESFITTHKSHMTVHGKGDYGHYCSQLGFCITDTGTVAACRKEEQALSRMGVFKGRTWATPKSYMPRTLW